VAEQFQPGAPFKDRGGVLELATYLFPLPSMAEPASYSAGVPQNCSNALFNSDAIAEGSLRSISLRCIM
jgi:hypothetical protein